MTLYLEDLEPGQHFSLGRRTITEAHLDAFMEASGDRNPIHRSGQVAGANIYGGRVVHGILGLSTISGLLYDTGLFVGSTVAILSIEDWVFHRPLFIGDTVGADLEILSARATRHPDRGIVDRRFTLRRDDGEVLQQGRIPLMIRTRPPQADLDETG